MNNELKAKPQRTGNKPNEVTIKKDDTGFFLRAFQRAALEAVGKGDTDSLDKLLKAFVFWGSNSTASIALRKQKNRFIAFCTLICDKACLSGVSGAASNDIWEKYTQLCEDSYTAEKINALTIRLLMEMTLTVKRRKTEKSVDTVERVKAYVEKHLHERISVSKLSKHVGLNANYLNITFKKQAGQNITEYIREQKIEEAKRLMKDKNMTLSDIWTQLAYYDQSHFSKAFKTQTGITPKRYLSMNNNHD